jgi:hypothetical protein
VVIPIALMVLTLQVRNTPDCSAPVWGDLATQFSAHLAAYEKLRSELEKGLPPLAVTANPGQTSDRVRALANRIRVARGKAKPGDIFTPAIGALFKQALRHEMDAHTWQILTDDDNPGEMLTQINGTYAIGKSLSTVPPSILAALPRLPADIEYRFVERHLILLDTRARLILDRLPYAIHYTEGDPACR